MQHFSRPVLIYVMYIFLTQAVIAQDRDPAWSRSQMVKTQIEARGITDSKVLKAFREVPRHKFIPMDYQRYAYFDQPLPIEEGQTISQPFIVAFMTDALDLKRSDRVLEIGTGSGYQAAILAQLCDSVFSVEIFETLTQNAREVFKKLHYENIFCKTGDGYEGWEEKAPFDAVIVTCSPTHIPEPLTDQLAEGGRMIIPIGEKGAQQLVLLQKKNGKVRQRKVLSVRFVPMINDKYEKY